MSPKHILLTVALLGIGYIGAMEVDDEQSIELTEFAEQGNEAEKALIIEEAERMAEERGIQRGDRVYALDFKEDSTFRWWREELVSGTFSDVGIVYCASGNKPGFEVLESFYSLGRMVEARAVYKVTSH